MRICAIRGYASSPRYDEADLADERAKLAMLEAHEAPLYMIETQRRIVREVEEYLNG